MPKPSSFITGLGKFLNPVRYLLSKQDKYLKLLSFIYIIRIKSGKVSIHRLPRFLNDYTDY